MASNRYAKQSLIVVPTVLAFCLASSIAISAKEPGEASGPQGHALARILQERRSVLKELVNAQIQAYRANEIGLAPVVRAHRQLFSAELELETRPEGRIKLTEDFVKTMSDWENMAEEMFKKGKGTRAVVLQAIAWRLEAQAQLLRELEN